MNRQTTASDAERDSLPREIAGVRRWWPLIVSALLTALLLARSWGDFTRPFEDTLQESLASFHSYGFALSNRVLDLHNPFIARELNCYLGEVREYNHWPNGFFAFFNGVISVFGMAPLVGRLTALILGLAGLSLIVMAFYRRYPLVAFLLPLTVASSLGRDALSFVFIDAVSLPILGAVWFLTVRRQALGRGAWLLRLVLFVSPFFLHLTSIFTLFAVVWAWTVHRSWRRALADLACWLGGLIAVLIALSWTSEGLSSGARELLDQYIHRASLDGSNPEYVTWSDLVTTMSATVRTNVFFALPWSSLIWLGLAITIVVIWLARRNPATLVLVAAITLSTIVYSLALRNYIGVHLFARLPVTVLLTAAGLIALSAWVTPSSLPAWTPRAPLRPIAARTSVAVAVLALSLVGLMMQSRSYSTDEDVVWMSATLSRISQNSDLSDFNQFQDTNHATVDPRELFPRMCQYYFGPQIVDSLKAGLPDRVFPIDLTRS